MWIGIGIAVGVFCGVIIGIALSLYAVLTLITQDPYWFTKK